MWLSWKRRASLRLKDLVNIGDGRVEAAAVLVVDDDSQAEMAEVVVADFHFGEGFAEIVDEREGGGVNENGTGLWGVTGHGAADH